MSTAVGVLLKLSYTKDNNIYDDLLEDEEIFIKYADICFEVPVYIDEDNKIYQGVELNYYAKIFELEYEEKNNFLNLLEEKGIEKVYIQFCDYSYWMFRIIWEIMEIDIKSRKVMTKKIECIEFIKYFEKMIKDGKIDEKMCKKYLEFSEGLYEEDEELQFSFIEEIEEKVEDDLKENFLEFLEKTKFMGETYLEFKNERVEEKNILKRILNFFRK